MDRRPGPGRTARSCPRGSPTAALGAGIVTVPEDPLADWVVPGLSVLEHVALGQGGQGPTRQARGCRHRLGRRAGRHRGARQDRGAAHGGGTPGGRNAVRRQHPAGPADAGARGRTPRSTCSAYPTRGLDIASARRVHELVLARRRPAPASCSCPRTSTSSPRCPTGSRYCMTGGCRRPRRRDRHPSPTRQPDAWSYRMNERGHAARAASATRTGPAARRGRAVQPGQGTIQGWP